MKVNEIKKLIDSFYEGQTSREEELLLSDYFRGDEVAEELENEKELFLQLFEKDEILVPVSLENNLSQLIDGAAKAERIRKKPKQIKLWVSVAASMAILISVGFLLRTPTFKADYSKVIEADKQIADSQNQATGQQFTEVEFKQAEDAMLLLSANFSKGMDELNDFNDKIEEANEIINSIFNKKE